MANPRKPAARGVGVRQAEAESGRCGDCAGQVPAEALKGLWRAITGLICGVAAMAAADASAAERVRIAGSDLVGATFVSVLEKHAAENAIELTHAFEGSRAGLSALKAGRVDVAIVALAPDEGAPEEGFGVEPLAYRIAVMVVPQAIDVSEITLPQLEGFFGTHGSAGHTLWRDLGATGAVAPLTVSTHVLVDAASAPSVELFSHLALWTPQLKSSVVNHETLPTLLARLAAEDGGLALLPQLPADDAGLRVLAVARKKGEPAFGPTQENIHTGDYPLRWPLYVVYRREYAERLRAVRYFLASEEAAKSLAVGGLWVPVPAVARVRGR